MVPTHRCTPAPLSTTPSPAQASGRSPARASWSARRYVWPLISAVRKTSFLLWVAVQTVESGFQTIIDSGTTIIYGPPSQVAAFYQAIPGAQLYDSQSGFYSFPCSSTPSNVAFSWGGNVWTISAANFNLGRVSMTQCIGAIAGQDLGLGSNTWLLGDRYVAVCCVEGRWRGC